MAIYVENGYPVFTGLDGKPLEEGYVFIGVEGLNPLSNPQQAYWDEGLTIPAYGVRTKAGYASYNGSPGRLHTENAYSLLVQDKHRQTVYYQPTSVDISSGGTGGGGGTVEGGGGIPLGGILPHNGLSFAGFLPLGSDGLNALTYQELFNSGLDLIINNGDGTFSIRNSGYSTDWQSNSDWTDVVITVIHELKQNMTDLDFEVFVSSLGTEATSIRILDTSFSPNPAVAFEGGISAYGVDQDSFQLRTGTDGLDIIDTDGTRLTLTNQTWYYKVVARRKDLPYPAQVKAFDVVDDIDVVGGNPVATIIEYPVFGSPIGYLPFDFSNAVSQNTYSALYAVVGDRFEQQHIDAGDPASGSGFFYPTPVPGDYTRTALPDIPFTNAEVSTSGDAVQGLVSKGWRNALRPGTPYKFEVTSGSAPAGLVDGQEYWISADSTDIALYTSEDNAISGSSPVSPTTTGFGTFRLTQEGLTLDHAFQGHWHQLRSLSGGDQDVWDGTGGGGNSTTRFSGGDSGGDDTSVQVTNPRDDGTNGPPQTSNETRPSSVITYKHIKAQEVIETTKVIQNNSSYNIEEGYDISTDDVAIDLTDIFNQADGFIASYFWSGGDGTAELTFDGGSYPGKTIGLVDADTLVADLKGQGMGRITFQRDGLNLRILTQGTWDSDGGEFGTGRFSKNVHGVISQSKTFANTFNTNGGTNYDYVLNVVSLKNPASMSLEVFTSNTSLRNELAKSWAQADDTEQWTLQNVSIAGNPTYDVTLSMKGRWTTAYPRNG